MVLSEFMKKANKSQNKIAKEMGLSAAVISQFLNDAYTGNNEEIAQAINKYLTIGNERLNNALSTKFYKGLYNTVEVLFAANYAHKQCDIALVSGDSGAGKTTALEYYARNNIAVIFVTANAAETCVSAILGMICEKLKLPTSGKRSVLMKTLVTHLTGTNRLIIIDEADLLTLSALQAVRNLNDKANVGIVLAGNDRIYLEMRKNSKYDQIRKRIMVRKRVSNSYSVEEIQHILPGLDDGCTGFFLNLAETECLRTASKLYDLAVKNARARNQQITVKFLEEFKSEMMV